MNNDSPDFILYAQHGWADTHHEIDELAQELASASTKIVSPNLGWFKTWLEIEPLIEQVERKAIDIRASYPNVPARIIGHSMGGLIWLEVLNRHREWWDKIHSLVLIASPVGGSDLARTIDPLGVGIGIAKDLGINRRKIAEEIANVIPTLVIAGDVDNGSDGTITIESTKLFHSQFICLPDISHADLKNHRSLVEIIQGFWSNPGVNYSEVNLTNIIIKRLHLVPGITDAHQRDFVKAKPYLTFSNGISICIWKNPLQVTHVFLASKQGEYLYGGFVGWQHTEALNQVLQDIQKDYHYFLENRLFLPDFKHN